MSLLFQLNQPGRELGVPLSLVTLCGHCTAWKSGHGKEHRAGFPQTPLMRKARRKGAWGDAAAPCCIVELTCQVEQSVPQSQGIQFSTKTNQKEKGKEKAGVAAQLMEFPFAIGSVAQKTVKAGQKKHTSEWGRFTQTDASKVLYWWGSAEISPLASTQMPKNKFIPFTLGIWERLGSFPLRNWLP